MQVIFDAKTYLPLEAKNLRQLALDCGADDAGVVSIERPEIDSQRADILRFYPRARSLLSYVCRLNREPVRSTARSVSNVEQHQTGDLINEVGHNIVRQLEQLGVGAVNPPMAFPMEAENWPGKMWLVGHKPIAVAAGLGKMGIHRSVIHPRFGSFILLGTVVLETEVTDQASPIDFNPCVTCKLCVAVCPVGAIGPDGHFDFSACYHHNYREYMGGFGDWAEQIANSKNGLDYRKRVSPPESVSMWQSLGFGPNYKSGVCIAVCPAGEDVIQPFLNNKSQFVREIVKPFQDKQEDLYIVPGTDAEGYAKKRFPNKRIRLIDSSILPQSITGLLRGMPLSFQRGTAQGLDICLHFIFSGRESAQATVQIRDQKISVKSELLGSPDTIVHADSDTWLRFVRRETGILWPLLSRRIRVKGSLKALRAFGRCFPGGNTR